MRDSQPDASFYLFWCSAFDELNSKLTYLHLWYLTNADAVMSFLMSWPFNLWSRYSRRTLITWTKDKISEPKAKEPVWYLDRRRKQKATVSIKHISPVPQIRYPTCWAQHLSPFHTNHTQHANTRSATNRRARPKEAQMGLAGRSSGFLNAQ